MMESTDPWIVLTHALSLALGASIPEPLNPIALLIAKMQKRTWAAKEKAQEEVDGD